MLTPEQQLFFQTFGYLYLPKALPPRALEQIGGELQTALDQAYERAGGAAHEKAVLTMGARTPLLAGALEQPFFIEAARALFGKDALGIATYGASHQGDTGWHADCPHAEPRGVKFSIYLRPTTAESGALRVIPGSHRAPFHDAVRDFSRGTSDSQAFPAVVLPSQPGDVIAFDLRLFHAALGGGADRRVLNLFYYGNPQGADAERLVREQIVEDFEWLYEKNRAETDVFDAYWLGNPGGSDARRDWIKRFDELGLLGGAAAASTQNRFPDAMDAVWRAATQSASNGRWSMLATSLKRELARVRFATDGREVTLLIRPEGDPHPCFHVEGGLNYCYSTLDCAELSPESFAVLEAIITAASSTAAEVRARIADAQPVAGNAAT